MKSKLKKILLNIHAKLCENRQISKSPQFLDQSIFESWVNSILIYSDESHSRCEKDKMLNSYLIFLVRLLESYY